jgi:hypothetical protein
MNHLVYAPGNQVCVTSYGPFRGLRGTVLAVDQIVDDLEEPFCFYLVALEGASLAGPVWFEYHEVESVGLDGDVGDRVERRVPTTGQYLHD